jgi:hypothetical protein
VTALPLLLPLCVMGWHGWCRMSLVSSCRKWHECYSVHSVLLEHAEQQAQYRGGRQVRWLAARAVAIMCYTQVLALSCITITYILLSATAGLSHSRYDAVPTTLAHAAERHVVIK